MSPATSPLSCCLLSLSLGPVSFLLVPTHCALLVSTHLLWTFLLFRYSPDSYKLRREGNFPPSNELGVKLLHWASWLRRGPSGTQTLYFCSVRECYVGTDTLLYLRAKRRNSELSKTDCIAFGRPVNLSLTYIIMITDGTAPGLKHHRIISCPEVAARPSTY